MQNAGLDVAQARIRIVININLIININNLRYVDDTTLMSDSEGELKSLWKVKE